MTPSRIALASACLILALPGQLFAQETIRYTVNAPVTRVPVPGGNTRFSLDAVMGPDLYLCGAGNIRPADLKLRLGQTLRDATVAQVRELIAAVESAPNRVAKFGLMFGRSSDSSESSGTAGTGFTPKLPASWSSRSTTTGQTQSMDAILGTLALGQEVELAEKAECFMSSQIDAINAEGLRVIRAVAQQHVGGPPQAPQKPVTPGAAPQQLKQ